MPDPADPATEPPLYENGHIRVRRCRNGVLLYNVNDVYCGTMLHKYGEFSEGETDLFRQIVKPGMTVLEVGANMGAHTVAIAQLVGPQGRVIAFEPQRTVFQILCANLALNGLEYVEAHWAASGSEPGRITVPRLDGRSLHNFGGLSLGAHTQGDQVPLIPIDTLDLPALHLIKIDVEGMEADVVRGASGTIARLWPILYVENDRRDKSPELISLLLETGYRCYWHTPPYVRTPNYRNAVDDQFQGMISVNMLCIPRSLDLKIEGFREVAGPDDDWRGASAAGTHPVSGAA